MGQGTVYKLTGGRSWLRGNAEEGRSKSGHQQYARGVGPSLIVGCRSVYTVVLSPLRRGVSTQRGNVLCGWKEDNPSTTKGASAGLGGLCSHSDVFLSLGVPAPSPPQNRSGRSILPPLWVIGL